jgi:iron complex transport system substrate-binding protein
MAKRLIFKLIILFLTAPMILTAVSCAGAGDKRPDKDREGNAIALPKKIERIITMGPSVTEVFLALGFGDKIIAADEYSSDIDGLNKDVPLFSMMEPDGEQIINLQPDAMFVTGMTKAGGEDPFTIVADAGVCIIYIPASTSIEGIKEDIRYMADVMGVPEKGGELVAGMDEVIDDIAVVGATIANKRTVYFEIAAAPYMYSFGSGTFLNEMIELIGAVNILGNYESWMSVTEETVLEANPDVILTSVYYIDDPVGEIMSRPGWDTITAVQNGDVYYIDANSSNRPNHNIVKALREMGAAVYPGKH